MTTALQAPQLHIEMQLGMYDITADIYSTLTYTD